MQIDWRAISGPALTTATAFIAIALDHNPIAVPNPAPLFVCIVALAASISGLASGLISAAIAVGASALFWWVSWRGWPRRVFALAAEIPGVQARFRRVSVAMAALVACAFVVGVAAAHLR